MLQPYNKNFPITPSGFCASMSCPACPFFFNWALILTRGTTNKGSTKLPAALTVQITVILFPCSQEETVPNCYIPVGASLLLTSIGDVEHPVSSTLYIRSGPKLYLDWTSIKLAKKILTSVMLNDVIQFKLVASGFRNEISGFPFRKSPSHSHPATAFFRLKLCLILFISAY